jgi:hypothetical protein
MAQVVEGIQRVTRLVGEISSATAEQSASVDQVAEAVRQMDRGTQQNAAMVEESTAAAGKLKEQAQLLMDSVAVFRLPGAQDAGVFAPGPGAEVRTLPVRRREPAALRPAVAALHDAPLRTGTDDWTSF